MAAGVIRTPDQRLRVFVSSTLGELAQERAAARAVIEQLRLSPVLFELGARPHPPRELYRAYLAQSHVFVGIYWQRYGWVAPGEAVSGLEDEYRLAGDRPRLLYLKQPAEDREPRLTALLEEMRDDDLASYKRFSSTDELATLLANDLALLLTERFETADAATGREPDRIATEAPPVPLTATMGRDAEIAQALGLLRRGERLVTLTGAGGIGKTRLALELARAAAPDHPDGVVFVPLAPVSDPALVLRRIADHLGARIEGTGDLADAIAEHLFGQQLLLILDNFEQVVAAAGDVSALLERCPDLAVLVTSRQALRVRGERDLPVTTLPLPDPDAPAAELEAEPAVRLFADRARAVRHDFALTDGNLRDVAELCRRLDGLPLAIELAAARSRLLSPAMILDRLGDRLDLLRGGADLPVRQRTLRSALEWSHGLLTEREQALFARVSVFSGGASLEALEQVTDVEGHAAALDDIASLVDKNLLVVTTAGTDGSPRFELLETSRVFASEQLDARDETDLLRRRHLHWFRRYADRAQPYLCGPDQRRWAERFDPERANLRAAVDTALDIGEDEAVIELAWDVYVFYWVRDASDEPDRWLARVREAGRDLDEIPLAKLRSLQALSRIERGDYRDAREALLWSLKVFRREHLVLEAAVTLKELANVHFLVDDDVPAATADLREASQLFASIDHDWGVGLVETMLGTLLAVTGRLEEATTHHRVSLQHSRRIDNDPLVAQATQQLALIEVLAGRPDAAVPLLDDAAAIVVRGGFQTGATYCLDTVAAVALAHDDAVTAARAVAVADAVRERLGTPVWPTVRAFVDGLAAAARRRLPADHTSVTPDDARATTLFATLEQSLLSVRRQPQPPGEPAHPATGL